MKARNFKKAILWRTCLLIGLAILMAYLYSDFITNRIESRFPAAGSLVKHTETDLHLFEKGAGPAIVLLHGASANLRDMAVSLMPELSQSFHVIAIDRPGHGYSQLKTTQWLSPADQARIIVETLKSKGIEQSLWVGHSWAGSVVMAGLLNHPDQVVSGGLIGAAIYPWQGGVDFNYHLATTPLVGKLFSYSLLPIIGSHRMSNGIVSAFRPNPVSPAYRKNTGIDLYLRPSEFIADSRDVLKLSSFLEQQSLRYSQIKQPILLIHGQADEIVPAWNHAHRLVEVIPDAQLVEFPEVGHQPHHVQTQRVVAEIKQLAKRTFISTSMSLKQDLIDLFWDPEPTAIQLWLNQNNDPDLILHPDRSRPIHLLFAGPSCAQNNEAVQQRLSLALSQLLDAGANPNFKDQHGNTPLHLAAAICPAGIIEQLLEAGSEYNSFNHRGLSPFELTLENASPAAQVLIDRGYRMKPSKAANYLEIYADHTQAKSLILAASGQKTNQ